MDLRTLGDRIIPLKFLVELDTFNVIGAYMPQVGLGEHYEIKFSEDLEGLVLGISLGEKIFLGGDLKGHVGS